jgi:hypothetical protein
MIQPQPHTILFYSRLFYARVCLQEEAKQSLQELIIRRHNATLTVADEAIQGSSSSSFAPATNNGTL